MSRSLRLTATCVVGAVVVMLAAAVGGAASAASWTQFSPSPSPPGRYYASVGVDGGGHVVLFGGNGGILALGDTWLWNGTAWVQPSLTSSPSGRAGAVAAADGSGNVVLFGGIDASVSPPQFKSDTWIWNGSTWTQASPAVSPPARYGATFARDATGHLVLFGGQGASGDRNDTWLWDGYTWAQASTGASPSVRVNAAAATGPDGNVVLFGGFHWDGVSAQTFQDTWVWNGSVWSMVTPSTSPPARSSHAMASRSDGTVLLFGGSGTSGFVNDTWLWDGSIWSNVSPAMQPSARVGAAMVTKDNDKTVLFGGMQSGGTRPTDTWVFDLSTDAVPPVIALPGAVVANATGPTGATVTFTVTATDNLDPSPVVYCTPDSGSVFTIGTTTVNCIACDSSGNTATGSFTVHVKGTAEQLVELGDAVKGVGPGRSLADKVMHAQAALGRNDIAETCSILGAFINEVKAQSGEKILPSTATTLITDVTRIKTVLGC